MPSQALYGGSSGIGSMQFLYVELSTIVRD